MHLILATFALVCAIPSVLAETAKPKPVSSKSQPIITATPKLKAAAIVTPPKPNKPVTPAPAKRASSATSTGSKTSKQINTQGLNAPQSSGKGGTSSSGLSRTSVPPSSNNVKAVSRAGPGEIKPSLQKGAGISASPGKPLLGLSLIGSNLGSKEHTIGKSIGHGGGSPPSSPVTPERSYAQAIKQDAATTHTQNSEATANSMPSSSLKRSYSQVAGDGAHSQPGGSSKYEQGSPKASLSTPPVKKLKTDPPNAVKAGINSVGPDSTKKNVQDITTSPIRAKKSTVASNPKSPTSASAKPDPCPPPKPGARLVKRCFPDPQPIRRTTTINRNGTRTTTLHLGGSSRPSTARRGDSTGYRAPAPMQYPSRSPSPEYVIRRPSNAYHPAEQAGIPLRTFSTRTGNGGRRGGTQRSDSPDFVPLPPRIPTPSPSTSTASTSSSETVRPVPQRRPSERFTIPPQRRNSSGGTRPVRPSGGGRTSGGPSNYPPTSSARYFASQNERTYSRRNSMDRGSRRNSFDQGRYAESESAGSESTGVPWGGRIPPPAPSPPPAVADRRGGSGRQRVYEPSVTTESSYGGYGGYGGYSGAGRSGWYS